MARSQTNYNTLGPLPENVVAEEPVQQIQEPDEYPGVQGTLGSIMMFLMRQSYIAALIIMMVSFEYKVVILMSGSCIFFECWLRVFSVTSRPYLQV